MATGYKWIGDTISEGVQSKRRAKKHYKTLQLPNLKKVSLGDCVLVQGGDEGDAEEYIARIISLFETGDEVDNKKAVVQWYMKPDEIPKRIKLPMTPRKGELFIYKKSKGSSSSNEIDAETIINRCQVADIPLSLRESFKLVQNGVKAFMAVWFFDGVRFDPIIEEKQSESDEESEDESEEEQEVTSRKAPSKRESSVRTPASKKPPPTRVSRTPANVRESSKKTKTAPVAKDTKSSTEAAIIGSSPRRQYDSADALEVLFSSDDEFTPRSQIIKKITKRPNIQPIDMNNNSPKKSRIENCVLAVDDLDDTIYDVVKRRNKSDKVLSGVTRNLESPARTSLSNESSLKVTPLKISLLSPNRPSIKIKIPNTVAKIIEREELRTPSRKKSVTIVEPPKSCPPERSRRASCIGIESKKVDETPRTKRRRSLKFDFTEIKEREDEMVHQTSTKKSTTTPKKSTTTPKKSNSTKNPTTPTSAKKRHSSVREAATPQILERATPRKVPGYCLEQARARLHVSAVPTCLPCRENEYEDILNFVQGHLEDKVWGCLYISGVPGTGKTATIHAVINHLRECVADKELDDFQYVEINGMKLTEPHQAFVQILKGVTGQKATPEHASNLLEKHFSSGKSKKKPTVLVVDELDLLWTRKQNVLYSIFDWPTKPKSGLIVVAIANTMDLPERIMMNRVSSRLGLSRMTFQPYNFKQLQEIVEVRLEGLKAFEPDAIQLAARKVAALSGDARRALDICRRAAEIADRVQSKKKKVVNMTHVDNALQEMFCSPKILAMQKASSQEQIFLRAIVSEFKLSGLEEAIFSLVLKQHINLCRIEGLQPPTVSEVWSVCLRLASLKLILLEAGFNELNKRIQLNVSQDDVRFAFSQSES